MAVEGGMFETLQPSNYVCFSYPNPCNHVDNLVLKVAVLDSPHAHADAHQDENVKSAAMLVPRGREDDWIFSTQVGHHQLLSSAHVSRLILIARQRVYSHSVSSSQMLTVNSSSQQQEEEEELKRCLGPLLLALSPRVAFQIGRGLPIVPFVGYVDNLVQRKVLEIFSSPLNGRMVVEDVLVEVDKVRDWRRRLRFERMPNLVQTEVPLKPKRKGKWRRRGVRGRVNLDMEMEVDVERLVHPYLAPIVAGLVLVGGTETESVEAKLKVLCIGVGGGALMSFLNRHFGSLMNIQGVERDEEVVRVATNYFGLVENEHLRIRVGDGSDFLHHFARRLVALRPRLVPAYLTLACSNPYPNSHEQYEEEDEEDPRMHVIIVDVDAADVGAGVSAPPLEFLEKGFLVAAAIALHPNGILAMNVIPPNNTKSNGECFYSNLIATFGEIFSDIHDIQVNDDNYVLFASPSRRDGDRDNAFANKVKQVISGGYVERIRHHDHLVAHHLMEGKKEIDITLET